MIDHESPSRHTAADLSGFWGLLALAILGGLVWLVWYGVKNDV